MPQIRRADVGIGSRKSGRDDKGRRLDRGMGLTIISWVKRGMIGSLGALLSATQH
jgi:hypothetical protein